MSRSSYRNRTSQRIPDILKSLTKKRLVKTNDEESGFEYEAINNMSISMESNSRIYEKQTALSTSALIISNYLSTVKNRVDISSNIMTGKRVPYLLAPVGRDFYYDGVQNTSNGYYGDGGIQPSTPISDDDNARISVDIVGNLLYDSVINAKTETLLYSAENSRPSTETIFYVPGANQSNRFVYVFINGLIMKEGVDYNFVPVDSIITTFNVEVEDRVEVYALEGELNAIYFDSFILNVPEPDLKEGSYIRSVMLDLWVDHVESNIYKISHNGAGINASNIKIGSTILNCIGNSEYIVFNNINPPTGLIPVFIPTYQYAEVTHINGNYVELYGSLAYSETRTFGGYSEL